MSVAVHSLQIKTPAPWLHHQPAWRGTWNVSSQWLQWPSEGFSAMLPMTCVDSLVDSPARRPLAAGLPSPAQLPFDKPAQSLGDPGDVGQVDTKWCQRHFHLGDGCKRVIYPLDACVAELWGPNPNALRSASYWPDAPRARSGQLRRPLRADVTWRLLGELKAEVEAARQPRRR